MSNKPLERQIERRVCDYAKSKGMLVYKFSSPAHASVPDRLIMPPHGRAFFIEFKREGRPLTPAQARECGRLIEKGARVYVVDSVDGGILVVNAELRGTQDIGGHDTNT